MTVPSVLQAPSPKLRTPVFVLSVLLVVFAGIRYGIGSDYFLYTSLYRAIIPSSLTESLKVVPQELGWVTLAFLFRKVTDSPYLILWIASVLTVVPALIAVKRKSQDPVFAVFLYFFLGYYAVSFNAVRQSIAVSFLLLADTYRSESRVKWAIFSAVAILFHSSAIVAIIVQLAAAYWKPRWVSVLASLVIAGAGSLALLNSQIVGVLAVALNSRYETYLEGSGAGLGTWMMFGVRLFFIILCLSLPRSRQTTTYLAYVCVSAMVLILGTTYVVIARFEPYFGIFLALLIPNLLSEQARPIFRDLRWPLALGCLIYFGFYVTAFNRVVPYEVVPELSSLF